jgi:hypothetical protein
VNSHSTHVEEIRALRTDRERVAHLLSRYPRVSTVESREILDFMQNGRHLEIGLLTSNDNIRPRLDAFMADHAAHFRIKWSESAAVIGAIVIFIAVCWLMWELAS